MKLSKYAIPYPILGVKGDFNESVKMDKSLDFQSTSTHYVFNVVLNVEDNDILKLIASNKACYACEIDCAKTYYRHVFKSSEPSFTISIPKETLVGSVQLFFSIVVEDEIVDYKSESFNQKFYEGYKFSLSKGHMLAFLGEEIFNADIKYNELKSLGSILDVKVDVNATYTYFDFGGDLITILMPQTEFDDFRKSNNHTFSDFTHASIVQCALISALSSYRENYNTLWAQTLNVRVQNDKNLAKFTDLENLTNKEIVELVSRLLDNPNRRMFGNISKLMNS